MGCAVENYSIGRWLLKVPFSSGVFRDSHSRIFSMIPLGFNSKQSLSSRRGFFCDQPKTMMCDWWSYGHYVFAVCQLAFFSFFVFAIRT